MNSFTHIINIDHLEPGLHEYHLVATKEDRQGIAKRLELKAVDQLQADLKVEKEGRLILAGTIEAEIQQECVRTLKVFSQSLRISVDEVFLYKNKEDEDESGEILEGDILDLGEVVVQLLSLELDPYPIAPGSEPVEYHDKEGKTSPFDVLKNKT